MRSNIYALQDQVNSRHLLLNLFANDYFTQSILIIPHECKSISIIDTKNTLNALLNNNQSVERLKLDSFVEKDDYANEITQDLISKFFNNSKNSNPAPTKLMIQSVDECTLIKERIDILTKEGNQCNLWNKEKLFCDEYGQKEIDKLKEEEEKLNRSNALYELLFSKDAGFFIAQDNSDNVIAITMANSCKESYIIGGESEVASHIADNVSIIKKQDDILKEKICTSLWQFILNNELLKKNTYIENTFKKIVYRDIWKHYLDYLKQQIIFFVKASNVSDNSSNATSTDIANNLIKLELQTKIRDAYCWNEEGHSKETIDQNLISFKQRCRAIMDILPDEKLNTFKSLIDVACASNDHVDDDVLQRWINDFDVNKVGYYERMIQEYPSKFIKNNIKKPDDNMQPNSKNKNDDNTNNNINKQSNAEQTSNKNNLKPASKTSSKTSSFLTALSNNKAYIFLGVGAVTSFVAIYYFLQNYLLSEFSLNKEFNNYIVNKSNGPSAFQH